MQPEQLPAIRSCRDARRQWAAVAAVTKKEAPVGVEPTMADLQSAALATWLRRRLRSSTNAMANRANWSTLIHRADSVTHAGSRSPGRLGASYQLARLYRCCGANT